MSELTTKEIEESERYASKFYHKWCDGKWNIPWEIKMREKQSEILEKKMPENEQIHIGPYCFIYCTQNGKPCANIKIESELETIELTSQQTFQIWEFLSTYLQNKIKPKITPSKESE